MLKLRHQLTLLSPIAESIPGTIFLVCCLQYCPSAPAKVAQIFKASTAIFLLLSFSRAQRTPGSSPISPVMNFASFKIFANFCNASFLTYNLKKFILT